MLQETQRQQQQRIIRKIRINIRKQFITNYQFLNAIKDRLDQPTFQLFTQAELLFLKVMGKQDVTDELKVLEIYFKSDTDADLLISEL